MRLKIAPKPTSPIPFSSFSIKSPKIAQTLVSYLFNSVTGVPAQFLRSQSPHNPVSRRERIVKVVCAANFDGFYEEHLSKQFEGVSQTFDLLNGDENQDSTNGKPICTIPKTRDGSTRASLLPSRLEILEPIMLGIMPEPPVKWPERDSVMRVRIERKANSVDLPFSLRMIKKKQKRLLEGFSFRGLGESDCCSLNKAFSSMVFIILELQKFYTLQMREAQCCDDAMEIVNRGEMEIRKSLGWLFQEIFSQTPNLMMFVMILLANFSVHSMTNNNYIQDHGFQSISLSSEMTETASVSERRILQEPDYDSSAVKSIPLSDNNGGHGYLGRLSLSVQYPDDKSLFSFNEDQNLNEEEVGLWNYMVDEVRRMQMEQRGVVLDHKTMESLTSPVNVEIESDDYEDYIRTNILYEMRLSQEPNNPLLLCNYAQFLFLVARDYDRAEEFFKRAIQVEPVDAESLSQYANFLWVVRKNLWGAEERYIQAIAAEPENPCHASKYANFLWNTGGEETCFPLNASYNTTEAQNL